MDGNGAACSRLILGLKSNSVVLKYDSLYELYYFPILKPWIHYIPIESDKDVLNIIELEKYNPGIFESISNKGKCFYYEYIKKSDVFDYVYFLLNIYERMFFNQSKKINFSEFYVEESELIESFAQSETLGQEGKDLFHAGNFAAAEQAFRATLARDDRDPNWHWWLSMVLDHLERKGEAAEAAEEATRRAPGAARYWEHLGHMRAAEGEIEAAERAFRRSCEIEPDRASALGALSHVLGALRRWEDAIATVRAALTLRPDDAEWHSHLGNLLMNAGKPGEAATAYRQAIALGRTGEDVEHQLAEALRLAEKIAATPTEESTETLAPATPEPIVVEPIVVEPLAPPTALAPDAPRHGFWRRIFVPRQVFGQ